MSTSISYGGYVFPHPIPFVGMSEEPVFISGQMDHGALNLTLVGEITGCGLTDLKVKKDSLVDALSSGFKTLTVGNTGYDYAKPLSIEFPDSILFRRLPYQINFQVYSQKDFSNFYGIAEPEDIWENEEQDDRIVSVSHRVSARALKTDGSDSITKAKTFVMSRMGDYVPPSLFFTGSNYIVASTQENIDRVKNIYELIKTYSLSDSNSNRDITGRIIRPSVSISYNAQDSLGVKVRGTIEGGISGVVSTGMFTPEDAKVLAQQSVARTKSSIEQSLYGEVFREPNSFSYNVNTGSNSISFDFSFLDPSDPYSQDIIHEYSVGVAATKDRSSVGVSLDGSVRYNSWKNPFTGSSPELETRFTQVSQTYSGVNHYALASEGFSWFSNTNLPYSKNALNPYLEEYSVQKKPFNSEISYNYNYSNGIDIFSGYLRNAQVSIETEHPISKYSIKPTTDNSFGVQELYTTLTRKTVNVRGVVNSNVNIQDAILFVSGWSNQYNTEKGILSQDEINTGDGVIVLSKQYIY